MLDEKWDGKTYYLKAKVSANPNDVAKEVDRLRQDKKVTKELEDSKRRTDALEKEVIRLRIELTAKPDTDKAKQYVDTINKLSAADWVEKGYSLMKGYRLSSVRNP